MRDLPTPPSPANRVIDRRISTEGMSQSRCGTSRPSSSDKSRMRKGPGRPPRLVSRSIVPSFMARPGNLELHIGSLAILKSRIEIVELTPKIGGREDDLDLHPTLFVDVCRREGLAPPHGTGVTEDHDAADIVGDFDLAQAVGRARRPGRDHVELIGGERRLD